jgi:hypothetical protein
MDLGQAARAASIERNKAKASQVVTFTCQIVTKKPRAVSVQIHLSLRTMQFYEVVIRYLQLSTHAMT